MNSSPEQFVTANGDRIAVQLPCTVADFLQRKGFPPGSVVVEHNGDAVAPSEFAGRNLESGDRLEIVRIVAGG